MLWNYVTLLPLSLGRSLEPGLRFRGQSLAQESHKMPGLGVMPSSQKPPLLFGGSKGRPFPCFIYFLVWMCAQSLSHIWLSMTPWTIAHQASLPSWSLLKLMSIDSVMSSNHLILCYPLLLLPSIFPSIRVFLNESLYTSGGQSIGASDWASVLPMNIQGWFPLGLTGLISLLSKGLSRVFSRTTTWKHNFLLSQPSLWSNSYSCTWLLEKP